MAHIQKSLPESLLWPKHFYCLAVETIGGAATTIGRVQFLREASKQHVIKTFHMVDELKWAT